MLRADAAIPIFLEFSRVGPLGWRLGHLDGHVPHILIIVGFPVRCGVPLGCLFFNFSLRVTSLVICPVFVAAGFAADLARDGLVGATLALASLLAGRAPFLHTEACCLLPSRLLSSCAVSGFFCLQLFCRGFPKRSCRLLAFLFWLRLSCYLRLFWIFLKWICGNPRFLYGSEKVNWKVLSSVRADGSRKGMNLAVFRCGYRTTLAP